MPYRTTALRRSAAPPARPGSSSKQQAAHPQQQQPQQPQQQPQQQGQQQGQQQTTSASHSQNVASVAQNLHPYAGFDGTASLFEGISLDPTGAAGGHGGLTLNASPSYNMPPGRAVNHSYGGSGHGQLGHGQLGHGQLRFQPR